MWAQSKNTRVFAVEAKDFDEIDRKFCSGYDRIPE